ncbi:MAG: apolipoprotein N-acyltransferase [Gammaproteobacteria bacterium]|nr:apolipoprotein N-acyltransferase [Gammaproteobacteria bacterium]
MILTGWKSDAIALLGGMVLPLAFAPFGWWPVAVLSLLLFQMVIYQDGTGRALWRAMLFGIGYFGVGVSWVYVSISLFGNATPLLAAAITFLLILVLSGYLILAVFLIRRFAIQGFMALLVLPAAWVLIEWLRGWLFTGFGWLDIGYAFIDTPVAAYGPTVGVLGLSFLVLLSSSGLFWLLNKQAGTGLRLSSALILIAIWLTPMLVTFPGQTQAGKEPVSVALLQGNIPQHIKWLKSQRQPTLNLYRDMTEAHWDKQLIVWPETAVPAYEDQVFDYLETLHTAAQLSQTNIMLGMPVRESHGDRYYNALGVLGNAQRGPESLYQKQHLVPFGEYLPLKFILDPLLDFLQIPMSNFSAGETGKPLVTAGAHKAGVFICFEIAFASDVRQALPEAAYLVNISNDAWFGDSLAPYQHLQMARMRALETGRYVLRATNTGITAIIDTRGDIQSILTPFETGVLTGNIQPMRGSTIYSSYGDYPLLALLSVILLSAFIIKRSGR